MTRTPACFSLKILLGVIVKALIRKGSRIFMRQSKLFTKTKKEVPADETSKNAQLLLQAGFIYKNMAGVYTFLPLGLRVIEKINTIIRREMAAIGTQEM